jgi:mannose-6-phosphate isomerase
MQHLFRLRNVVKKYEWGSPDWIPGLTGEQNPSGEPWAELWLGAHPIAPSMAMTEDGETPLNALVALNPVSTLGAMTAEVFGGIPFLLKLLAAARPLSIQAHPNLEQAKEGWSRENAAGIPLDAYNRNYKDSNHKPEILCALTPFRAMCGFREVTEIARLLDVLAIDELSAARRSLDAADEEAALRGFLVELFALKSTDRLSLGRKVMRRTEVLKGDTGSDVGTWELVRSFSSLYPEDPAIISPLYLNVLDLQPGEAIYLPAGILHAYVKGFGVELMANSDNVLRGGLTPKHVDLVELTRTLRFEPFRPQLIHPARESTGLARYNTPTAEFSLATAAASDGPVPLAAGAPYIIVVTEGSCSLVEDGGERLLLAQGESAFIAAGAQGPRLEGEFTVFVASVGKPKR